MDVRVGVDLGGTKTEAVVVSIGGDAPVVLAKKRVATEREQGYAHIVARTRDLIADVVSAAGIKSLPAIGVGMPGSRTRERLVKNSNTTCLNGRPFFLDLERAVGARITFANDANCFALAEATWGAARNARVAFGVIMGTGVGGGVVMNGRAWDGAQGIAGEWGHVVLDPEGGPPCYCGRRGCVETYLSGPAIEAAYEARTGTRLPLASIASSVEPAAKELILERMELFGRALATVIDVLDPEVVVLGGGVSNISALYDEGARAVARWAFTDSLATRIVKHELGDSAGVLGAALLP
jgi:fructokinase